MQISNGQAATRQEKKKVKAAHLTTVKKQRVVDPQVVLYQEVDFKVAVSNVSLDKKSMVRRKSHQNYLSWNDPFDINLLLDEKYWKHKRTKFVHAEEELPQLCIANKKDIVDTF